MSAWENDSPIRLTARGQRLVGWLVALGLLVAPGLSEALGSWLFGPTP